MTWAKDANDIVPDVKITSQADFEDSEKILYENFKILSDLLKNGATGSFTSGGHTLTITKGIITGIT